MHTTAIPTPLDGGTDPDTAEPGGGERPRRWLGRADRASLVLLVALPLLLEGLPALFGHLAVDGDNLHQNYPTRILAGELLRHGRLPLWDPYIWSGTPLLAGWNAGALYPGTWLFAVLPGGAAWTINMVSVSLVCGLGLYAFVRRLGCSPLASLLSSLSFTYAGFMAGQSDHYGLVAGMSFTPWILLAVHELASVSSPRVAMRWIALLGTCSGLVVLAGDPRSVSSAAIAAAIYLVALCWRLVRARRRPAGLILSVLAGVVLGVGLSAAQWLPGLSFLHESERAASSLASFAAGSLTWRDLELLFVPGLVGVDGLGLPPFIGSYSQQELSYAVGVLPLVAAFALLLRGFSRRAGRNAIGVWYAMIAVGLVLCAGANDPWGHVLASLPLYGGQRLQNRNAVLVDLALAVLLAVFVDALGIRRTRRGQHSPAELGGGGELGLSRTERLLGMVPVAVVVLLVVAAHVFGSWVQTSLGASAYIPDLAGRLDPYFAAMLVIAAGGAVVVLAGPRIGPGVSRALAAATVILNIGLGLATWPSMTTESPTAKPAVESVDPVATRLAALLGPDGRYAIFDPLQEEPGQLRDALQEAGPYDLSILHDLHTIQGYGSAVAGAYEQATGGHEVENLQPAALAGRNLDTLNLTELITLPQYLAMQIPNQGAIPVASGTPVPPGTEQAAEALDAYSPGTPLPSLPPVLLKAGDSSSWVLPEPLALEQVTVVTVAYRHARALTVEVGVLGRDDALGDVHAIAVRDGVATLRLHGRVLDGIWIGAGARTAVAVGAVAVSTARPFSFGSRTGSRRLLLDQILQGVLEPAHWRFQTLIEGLPVFTNKSPRGGAWVESADSTGALAPVLSGARAENRAVQPWQDPVTVVSSPRAALLVRSAAYDAGWSARITPVQGGSSRNVAVMRIGLVQGVEVPAGSYTVTWLYGAGLADKGLVTSVLALVCLLVLAVLPRASRRRRAAD